MMKQCKKHLLCHHIRKRVAACGRVEWSRWAVRCICNNFQTKSKWAIRWDSETSKLIAVVLLSLQLICICV